jgi:threonine synthase
MELPFRLICSACGRESSPEGLPGLCEGCESPLLASYDLEYVAGEASRAAIAERSWTMWRYREVLPLAPGEEPVTLGEGGTPLLAVPELAKQVGVAELWVKEEGLNPTGTFKARGLAAAVTRAAAAGVAGLVVPSAGNAAGALAAYGGRAGLPVRVFVPRDTPPAIVGECRALGAEVVLVDGVITDCGAAARVWARESGYFDVSTLKEPYRIEGKKTMGYELAEQLGWTFPDAIIYPTGGGTGLIGMWKAFAELAELGWVEGPAPRMYAVQAAGCAPIVSAWEAGEERARRWERPETVAAGLRVPSALGDFLILRALRESEGAAVAVSDSELLKASAELRRHGIGACPEGGATLAGLWRLRARGAIESSDRVICFNTGALLKYLH